MQIHLPSNMSEAEVLQIIEKVVCKLAPQYKFGYMDVDDIKQQGRMFALQALVNYDENRPLENFLYTHVKNRLINYKRDNYKRNDPPCKLCHNTIAGATGHNDGEYCERYLSWQRRNQQKQNIMNPLDISNICDERESTTREESSVVEDVATLELLSIIDDKLPVELRSVYLQMRDGLSVPKPKRLEVEQAILEIIGDSVCLTSVGR